MDAATPPERHDPQAQPAPPEQPAAGEEPATTTGALARLGFSRTDRVSRFLSEPALRGLGDGAAEALGAIEQWYVSARAW